MRPVSWPERQRAPRRHRRRPGRCRTSGGSLYRPGDGSTSVTSGAPRRPGGGPDRYGGPPRPPADGSIWDLRAPDGTIAPGWYLSAAPPVPRGDVPLRRAAEAGEPRLLPQLEPDLHPRPDARRLAHQSDRGPARAPVGRRPGVRPGDRPRRGGRGRGGPARAADPGRRRRRDGHRLQPLPGHLVPRRALLPGSDIVFVFAWTPLALAGAAGAPAVDTWMAPPGRAGRGPTRSRVRGESARCRDRAGRREHGPAGRARWP